ncbi:hypothetical protein PC9H_005793 [Pleurotus ostreatus]|uniref:Uncharacterized protein n=2 Tax=Pleurotus ostreatus TaxID=5322 RepID=A0A8H7DR35_PLEOS|nr:uncharacterized protein PC9H_008986 [Pleurotus ostreatus]XP_036633854.1 uncharacterized protein PC9H_005793 [Pleurotus ostreatus]KAF7426617.1 hypothetical protein PC9H_008986 [Pleurotus ostreatus]KAF7433827.1 hypothetical protein PC9H_005793 [Pleurotus ostreatus]
MIKTNMAGTNALFLLFIFYDEGSSDTAMGTESDNDDDDDDEEEEDGVIFFACVLFVVSWVFIRLARFMTAPDAELLPKLTLRTSRQVNTTVGMYI